MQLHHVPPGIWLVEKIGCCTSCHTSQRNTSFRWLAFVLTFLTYTGYHASRKPISVVKNVLNQDCASHVPPPDVNATVDPHWCDWQPFVGDDSNTLLGFLDSAYLFSYAIAMFFSGMLADRTDLRIFLTGGMLLSALFTAAFGAAFYLRIHSLMFFIAVQVAGGMCQASGWPGVVTVMANWNGKHKRGLIFGVWNSHTSVGNIVGSLLAAEFVTQQWGMSFVAPAALLALVAVVNLLFLAPHPAAVGCDPPAQTTYGGLDARAVPDDVDGSTCDELVALIRAEDAEDENETPAVHGRDGAATVSGPEDGRDTSATTADPGGATAGSDVAAVGFFNAIRIPGVLPFSVCLFFAKLVSYTFLYWLPRYLHSAAKYGPGESASLSALFDLGGIAGGVVAGLANDWTGAPASVCVVLLVVAIPMMFVYQAAATASHTLNVLLLVVVGGLVNGPYALITTAVSADLGSSLRGDARALATVTAIIDGTGSLGAALGPLLAGAVSSGDHWSGVFAILMLSDAIAVCSLLLLLRRELGRLSAGRQHRRQRRGLDGATGGDDFT